MNFKTTIALIVTLAVVGTVLFFTRNSGTKPTETAATPSEKKLLDIASADIAKLNITASDGKTIALERSGADWRMTAPLSAPADSETIGSLVDSLANLQSRGTVDPSGENAAATGLDQPSFRIELTTKTDKTEKLAIGNKSATGGNLYVQREGAKQADLVSADVYEQLDKPAAGFRDMRLVHAKTNEIQRIDIASPKAKVQLTRDGANNWTIASPASPTTMPADSFEMTDLVGALSNLRAAEFVAEEPGTSEDAKRFGFDGPAVTISYEAQAPATQPTTQPSTQASTQQAITGLIKLGRYDDVLKKNVYVASSITPAVAKVPASVLETFQKTSLELRDKKVLTIDPEKVTVISIATDKPATTQPTSRPAVTTTMRLARHHEEPAATQPATTQATTGPTTVASSQPATAPTEPPHKWDIVSDPKGPADDASVDELLAALNPLRAEKFIEPTTQPSTQPSDRYVLTLQTSSSAQPIEITITDRGQAQQPLASYNGASFEVNRMLIDRLEAKFARAPKSASP